MTVPKLQNFSVVSLGILPDSRYAVLYTHPPPHNKKAPLNFHYQPECPALASMINDSLANRSKYHTNPFTVVEVVAARRYPKFTVLNIP